MANPSGFANWIFGLVAAVVILPLLAVGIMSPATPTVPAPEKALWTPGTPDPYPNGVVAAGTDTEEKPEHSVATAAVVSEEPDTESFFDLPQDPKELAAWFYQYATVDRKKGFLGASLGRFPDFGRDSRWEGKYAEDGFTWDFRSDGSGVKHTGFGDIYFQWRANASHWVLYPDPRSPDGVIVEFGTWQVSPEGAPEAMNVLNGRPRVFQRITR